MDTSMNHRRPIPIYASNGEPGVLLVYPYLYNLQGEWVGWITPDRQVFSLLGVYVGYLTDDPRILRKRVVDFTIPRRRVPPIPGRVYPPANIPLARLMSDLPYDTLDVLMECPEDLHTSDSGEFRQDLD
jgi:hypothetical protein